MQSPRYNVIYADRKRLCNVSWLSRDLLSPRYLQEMFEKGRLDIRTLEGCLKFFFYEHHLSYSIIVTIRVLYLNIVLFGLVSAA